MLELLVVGAIALAVLAGIGLVGALLSVVFWVVLLPFRLIGLVFRGVAVLLALPFLLFLGLGILALIGVPLLFVLVPVVLPIALLIAGMVWLATRLVRGASPAR